MMLAVMLASLTVTQKAAAQVVGKTEVTIGDPAYTGNPRSATVVPFTMEINSTCKNGVNLQALVTEVSFFGNTNVPFSGTVNAPPTPGGGPVSYSLNFPVTPGKVYRIDITMIYRDANNTQTSLPATKTINP